MLKRNNKAQALVEFVLLLPILLMVLFIIIDFASIFYNKNHLEGILNDVVKMAAKGYNKNQIENKIDDRNIEIVIANDTDTFTVTLNKKIDLVTPFSSTILENPYPITTSRVAVYE